MASSREHDITELRARLQASEDLTTEQAMQIKDLKLEIKYLTTRLAQAGQPSHTQHVVHDGERTNEPVPGSSGTQSRSVSGVPALKASPKKRKSSQHEHAMSAQSISVTPSGTESVAEEQDSPVKHKKTKLTARKSTGGQAPRRPLSSTSATRSTDGV